MGIQKEEAVRLARQVAESSNPTMNSSLSESRAIYLPEENSWIVKFYDPFSGSSPASDYLLRVQATSGKAPELLRGSQKERYEPYFEKNG